MTSHSEKSGIFVRYLILFQALSLDVVGGALSVGLLMTRLFRVNPQPVWWPVLALSVWAVYTSDHLIDGYAQKQQAVIMRHRMHYRYRYFFMVGVALAALLALGLVYGFMNRKILLWGVFLGAGAFFYLMIVLFVRQRGFYFHKEFFIALFYVAGIALAPVVWYGKPVSFVQILTLTWLFLLAWAEGLLMAVYEQQEDEADKMVSFSTFYGQRAALKFAGVLLFVAFVGAFVLLFLPVGFQQGYLLLMAMALMLSPLVIWPALVKKKNRFRWLGEYAFWLPFLFFL